MSLTQTLISDLRQIRSVELRRSNFAAAAVNRLTVGLGGTTPLSSDAAMWGELKLMRGRARVLERNNDYMRKFLLDCHKNINGSTGVGLEPKCWMMDRVTPDKASAAKIAECWKGWSKKQWCTVTGKLTWKQVQRLIVRSVMRDGEAIVRKHRDPSSPYILRLQLLEADHIDDDYNVPYLPNGNRIVLGVELSPLGMPVAYHLLLNHPGDAMAVSLPTRRERVLAQDITHIYSPDRIGQTRGFPHPCSVMLRLGHLAGYEEAEIIASRAASQKMAAIIKATPEGWNGEPDGRGNVIEETEAGSVVELPMGMDIKPIDWNHPNAIYSEFRKGCLHGIASGLGVSYNFLASDLEGVSYSSLRSGALDERDTWKVIQDWLIDDFHQEVYDEWLFLNMLAGELRSLPGGIANIDLYNEPQWNPRRWDWVDPKNDVEANVIAVDQGFKSRRQIVAETTGRDLDDIYQEQEEDDELAESHNLSFPRSASPPASQPPAAPATATRALSTDNKRNGNGLAHHE